MWAQSKPTLLKERTFLLFHLLNVSLTLVVKLCGFQVIQCICKEAAWNGWCKGISAGM